MVVLFRLGDRREPLPQILRASRGVRLASIRLPGRNLGPHHVALALGVSPGLEVVHSAERVIALAPARLASLLLKVGQVMINAYQRLRRAVLNALKVVRVEPYRTGLVRSARTRAASTQDPLA